MSQERLVCRREVEHVEPGVADGRVEEGLVCLLAVVALVGRLLLLWYRDRGKGESGAVLSCVRVESGRRDGKEVPRVEAVLGGGRQRGEQEGQRPGGRGVVCGRGEVVANAGEAEVGLAVSVSLSVCQEYHLFPCPETDRHIAKEDGKRRPSALVARSGDLRLTCHFRHEGLKLGAPLAASSSDMKTCNVGRSFGAGACTGSSLGG